MHLQQFGSFAVHFGLVRGKCTTVSRAFVDWQMSILPGYGMRVAAAEFQGTISAALNRLLPRTAPISTRYLFWPLNEEWTLYFDNGRSGTDASPPYVLAELLKTDGIRITLSDHVVDRGSKRVIQYGGTIFEYFEKGESRRSIHAANDGGKWVFGQSGIPFSFEDENSYQARLVRDRFPQSLLLKYLKELNASVDETQKPSDEHGQGTLIVKSGQLPRTLEEFHE